MFPRLRVLVSRVRGFFSGHRLDEDFQEELASHLEMLTEENIRRGLPPDEARRQARLRLGGAAQLRETQHDLRGLPWLETLLQDVRFGLRMLRKNPGFTAVAVITLALGIGANTAIFSVVSKVLLDPLPYPNADRIVLLQHTFLQRTDVSISVPEFMIWREQTQVFQSSAAFELGGAAFNLTGGDRPEQVPGLHASAGYFDVFGVPIAKGRAFTPEEDRPGGPHVAVISNGLWRGRFDGDPTIIGKTISMGGDPYEVIGVVGRNFTMPLPLDIWLPLQADPNSNDQSHYLLVAARMRPGITLSQAKIAMKFAAEQFRGKFAGQFMAPGESATAELFRDTLVANVRPALLVLLGAVGFVLLLACANVANLLLARATIRKREIAVRSALGAGRGRVIRQLLTESLMLSLAGGILGLAVGFIGMRLLLAQYPNNSSRGFSLPLVGAHGSAVTLDWRILLFTIGVSILTGILFGLIPAFQASGTSLTLSLNESGGRGSTYRNSRGRSALVVGEVAIAVILLAGAALLIRTLAALRDLPLGFDAHNILTMQMSLSGRRFDKTARLAEATREAERRIGALPGVKAVALTCCLPLEGGPDLPFSIGGRAPTEGPYNGDEE